MSNTPRKSWQEKLANSKDLPRVIEINERMSKRWGTGTCVIPAPMEVDTLMRKVPKGKVTTINEIRAALARTHPYHHRLSDNHRHLCFDCCSGVGGSRGGGEEKHHTILADAEVQR